jgi:hypothetical protein
VHVLPALGEGTHATAERLARIDRCVLLCACDSAFVLAMRACVLMVFLSISLPFQHSL